MDDIVKAALGKWPNVPDCYGWLGLDVRGDWYLRDEAVQAAGPFPQAKGSRIEHEKLRQFIGRNYECDAQGRWYFQNGPQRVFVSLEAAPWVLGVEHIGSGFILATHTGVGVYGRGEAWIDEQGRLFIFTSMGLGLVRSSDMHAASEAVETGLWHPRSIEFDELPGRYGYRLIPEEG